MNIASLVMLLAMGRSLSLSFSSQKSNYSDLHNVQPQQLTKANDSVTKNIKFYVKNDSICFMVNRKSFCLPKRAGIDYRHTFDGLYEINGARLKKSDCVILNHLIYFTTYDDVGRGHRGYLYVFDTKTKTLVKDSEFNRNFLYSAAGIFIIDKKTDKVFCVSKSGWFDRKQIAIVYASMYSIDGANFRVSRIVYEKSDDLESDTSVVNFYYKGLSNNAKGGIILPKDWWKEK